MSWCRWSMSTARRCLSAPGARAARTQRSPGHRFAVPRRARSHPQGRPDPPRHQAGKHHAHPGRSGRRDRLRPRPSGNRGRRPVSGTPAYMSPNRGGTDARRAGRRLRSGVVLAEDGEPRRNQELRLPAERLGRRALRAAKIPDTPWAQVIQQAVRKTARVASTPPTPSTRALEDVTLRVEGADDLHPYPGLASFTEADAEYFFGREAEVEQMWRKLEGPPRMLAIIGPSGAGKSSFLAAGLRGPRSAGLGDHPIDSRKRSHLLARRGGGRRNGWRSGRGRAASSFRRCRRRRSGTRPAGRERTHMLS